MEQISTAPTAPATPPSARANRLRALLQAAVGIGALVLVCARIDRHELMQGLAHVDLTLLTVAVALNFFMTYLMAVRWQRLIAVKYREVGSVTLFYQYLVAQFFNLFTPGAVGGDVARLLEVGKLTGDRGFIFATLVVERLVGLCGLVLGGLGGVYLGRRYLDHPATYYAIAAIMLVGLALSSVIFSARAMALVVALTTKLEERFARVRVSALLARLTAQFSYFASAGHVLAASVIFTFVIRIVWVFSCWEVARALGIFLPFTILMAFIAIVDIARMMPIAPPNGLGVREYLLVLLLGQLGVTPAQALLFSLFAYTILMLNGIIGGVLYAARGAAHYRAARPR
jgi:uncharacterized protein (TIRG00374 family)